MWSVSSNNKHKKTNTKTMRKIFIRGTQYNSIQIHSYHYGNNVGYINALAAELKKDFGLLVLDGDISVYQYGGRTLSGITYCATSVPSSTVMPDDYEEVYSFEPGK